MERNVSSAAMTEIRALCAQQAKTVNAAPLDVAERKRLAALYFMAGDLVKTIDELTIALVLPVADEVRRLLVPDISIVVPAIFGQGRGAVLEQEKFRNALSSHPDIVQAAYVSFSETLANGNPLRLDGNDVAQTLAFFSSLGAGPDKAEG